ncbi:hypothetical protein DU977_18965 [Vibrio cholerae]|nr:hypothetical protein [Vibrio cholerae]
MRKIIVLFSLILFSVGYNLSYAGGGAASFVTLKPPIVIPDGNVSDWEMLRAGNNNGLIHLVHEESGIELFSIEHTREERGVTHVYDNYLTSFLLKVPKSSELNEALISIKYVKGDEFLEFNNRSNVRADLPRAGEKHNVYRNIRIGRNIPNDNQDYKWKDDKTGESKITRVSGKFEGALSLTPIIFAPKNVFSNEPPKYQAAPYFPHYSVSEGGPEMSVYSKDDDNYEYIEISIVTYQNIPLFDGYNQRIFVTYSFAKSSHEAIEVADNLMPSRMSPSPRVVDPFLPYPYEEFDSFFDNGVSVQLSVTAHLGLISGSAMVTSNLEETLADVSLSSSNNDVELELGLIVYNTSDIDAITEGLFASASYDFFPVLSPGITMVSNPDFNIIGIGGTVGVSGMPGWTFASGIGIDGAGGTTAPPTQDNLSTGGVSSSGGSDGNENNPENNPDHDAWTHDDEHTANYDHDDQDNESWGHDDDSNAGYF